MLCYLSLSEFHYLETRGGGGGGGGGSRGRGTRGFPWPAPPFQVGGSIPPLFYNIIITTLVVLLGVSESYLRTPQNFLGMLPPKRHYSIVLDQLN